MTEVPGMPDESMLKFRMEREAVPEYGEAQIRYARRIAEIRLGKARAGEEEEGGRVAATITRDTLTSLRERKVAIPDDEFGIDSDQHPLFNPILRALNEDFPVDELGLTDPELATLIQVGIAIPANRMVDSNLLIEIFYMLPEKQAAFEAALQSRVEAHVPPEMLGSIPESMRPDLARNALLFKALSRREEMGWTQADCSPQDMVTGTAEAIEEIMTLEDIGREPITAETILKLSHIKITKSGKEKDLVRWKDCSSAHKQFVIAVARELVYRHPRLNMSLTKEGPIVQYQSNQL